MPRDSVREAAVLAQAKVPPGFAVTVFAGPPVAMYPTVVAPSPDGSVYIGVDLNLAQGTGAGRGRVMRLIDDDNDGRADRYSTFVEVASPRGIIAAGRTVYVMHPPNLTAYRDTTGDGIADASEDLVTGLGFGLEERSSDHSTNNITMGIDGWIYVAVGDYGYANAVGRDGTKIRNRGGSVVRVRPDGTGLEVYATGTRNTYDIGIDPFMHIFARDNTNDGGGWNTRFHYIPPLADFGYPTRFLNFGEETMQSLFDFGAGAGTGATWVQDPGFPAAWNNQLYSADWTLNRVFINPVTPRGASYTVTQRDFVEISHPVDFAMDDRSHMYVASLIGGVFNYAGDTVGAILQVSHTGLPASKALLPARQTVQRLLAALLSGNAQHRLWAQRELVQRGRSPSVVARLRSAALDRALPAEARAAALFTLPQLVGVDARATLLRAAGDPALREVALRLLVDDRRHVAGLAPEPFVAALRDASLATRVQGINGLVRLDARAQAAALVPLLSDADSTIAHLAVQALARLGARDTALQAMSDASPVVRTRARHALQQMRDPATVAAVLVAVAASPAPPLRAELLATLARLYHTEAAWDGAWWGTRPSTVGPYFVPATWEQSAAIRPVLRAALSSAAGSEMTSLLATFTRNRVLPQGATPLLVALTGTPDQALALDAMVGSAQLDGSMLPLLTRLDAASPSLHAAVARMLAAETALPAEAMPLVKAASLDSSLPDTLRGQLLTAVAARPGAPADAVALLALVNPEPAPPAGAAAASQMEAAWRRYIGARERNAQLDDFVGLTRTGTAAQRTLAYAVLLQAVRNPRAQAAVREKVQPVLSAAFADSTSGPLAARAVRIMKLDAQYAEQLKAFPPQ